MTDDILTRDTDGNLAVRTVSSTGDNYVNPDDVYTRDSDGNLCVRVTGQGGGGDQHNLGYFATQAALVEAYPTAEAGDWAIVGATDTVWIWDTDTSAWKDSDQKGQVTSVNGQTGAAVLNASDVGAVPQYSTMPTATAEMAGNIVQFTGTTGANYTNGYFYKCVSDGQDPATYSWTQTDVQPSPVIPDPLPSQTGNAGKFLTTDGTDARWSDKPLANESTGRYSIKIGGGSYSSTKQNAITIGYDTQDGSNSVTIGVGARVFGSGTGNVVIGQYGYIGGNNYCIAIGEEAKTGANNAIQLNASGSSKTNSDANTFKVANANGNFEIMSADGTIPKERLANVVSTPSTMPTLAVADWSNNTQTVNVTGVTATNTVFVSPAPASATDYASAGIICTAQGAGTLTFTCTTTPTNAITVNVVCL